jgi:hypothetical protein
MPSSFSVVGFFCDDIREEKSGQDTVVGILADNFKVPSAPGMMGKLGIYVRMHFDVTSEAKKLQLRIKIPGATDLVLGPPDEQLIENSIQEAKIRNFPFAGVILRAVISPFHIREFGTIVAIIKVDDTDYPCAVLNVIPNQTNASQPPSSQSQPAASQS